jgi:hypothetical protein
MPASTPGTGCAESSHTHVQDTDHASDRHSPAEVLAASHDNLEDKIPDKSEDEWERDPANPRNWSPAKKWTTTAIVSSSVRDITNHKDSVFLSGWTLHFCNPVSKFYHGTWFARPGHKVWHNQSNNYSVDSQHLPSVIRHRSFICRTLVRSIWSCVGASFCFFIPVESSA